MSVAEVGSPLDEVALCKYRTNTVPKPHSAFDAYILEIAPTAGLSWIKAIGHTVETNSYGSQLIAVFETMERRLANIYGKYEKTDLLLLDSIWNEPRDWMQALISKERILMTVWSPEKGGTLSDSLTSVGLIASATDTSSGYVAIEYYFANADVAEAEIASLEDDAL